MRRKNYCAFNGCEKPAFGYGLCSGHYTQSCKGQPLRPLRDTRPPAYTLLCRAENCTNLVGHSGARGLCCAHLNQIYHSQELHALSGRAPNGTGHIDTNGYHKLTIKGKTVFAQRRAMEVHLGRPLEKHENVHHKNGQRADNRIENLELWSKAQPSGQRVIDKLKWAREILQQYKDEEWLLT